MQTIDRLAAYTYRPRIISFLGARTSGRWSVKIHVITIVRDVPGLVDIVEAGWSKSASVLRDLPETDVDTNIGFITLHVGLAGVWLLIDRWEDGDILRHHHFKASLDDPTRFLDVSSDHYGPCVWELAVQAHERQAWIADVLANKSGPNIVSYLQKGLNAEL
ncbi:hypothetical protein [Bradyrhizobium sp. SRS-191]|uniref:hypothetical protein n=1 Tax=Bradyrhizobium sp. SRS-191 TaxID=2962606 RepID=UPI00211E0ACD|nr:hypothetical protein [Bradyrhizobium sp. SRS-191]